MRRLIERLPGEGGWYLRRHGPLLGWLTFLVWLAWGVRATLTTEITMGSVLDDLGFVLLAAVLFASAEQLDRVARIATQSGLALLLLVAVLIDTLHFRFFGSYVSAEDVFIAGEMGAAAGSILDLLTPWVVVCGVLVPLALIGLAIRATARFRRRRPGWGLLGLVAAGGGALLLHSAVVGGLATAAYNNPVMLFGRQLAFGSVSGESLSDDEQWERVREHADEAYNWPDPEEWMLGEDPEHPLLKIPAQASAPERRHNVVVLLMESVRAYETREGLGSDSVTPNVDRLMDEGLSTTDYYHVGHQTVRGEGAVLCSTFTHFGGAPIYVRFAGVRMKCLPEILRDHGYDTYWISSFRSDYFNKQEFLSRHGVDRFHDMSDFRGELTRPRIGWGPADEDLAQYAVDVLGRSERPFFASIMTLSNHHPFDHPYPIPDPPAASDPRHDRLYRNYLRGVHYTDHGVGRFFELAREQDWFDDTIFVVTGDHGTMSFPGWLDRDRHPAQEIELFYRGVLAITGPGVPKRRLPMVSSQVDVAPTVLDLLGIRAPNSFMGVSLLGDTPPAERFAVFASATEWNIRQADRYCYAVGTNCLDEGYPSCPAGISRTAAAHACFATDHDLLRVEDARVGPSLRLLPDTEAASLSTRGERVTRFTNFLLEQDAIYPYPAEEPDGM